MGQIKIVFMKRVIFVFLVLFIFTNCTCIIPTIKREFKYCFTGEKTGLDTLISINGYYAPSPGITQWNGRTWANDTLSPAYIFYDNGFVEANARIRYYIEHKKLSFLAKRWGDYGRYILHGDTIKLQYFNTPEEISRNITEIWFKIIGKNTIQRIPVGDTSLQRFTVLIYVFRPFEIKVKPEETWIYNKSWFRCK